MAADAIFVFDEETAQCERMVADDITVIDEETTQCERMVADDGNALCRG